MASLNFVGVGFSFAAKDTGLLSYQDRVAKNFANLNDKIAKMGEGFAGAVDPIGNGLDKLADKILSKSDKVRERSQIIADSIGKVFKAPAFFAEEAKMAFASVKQDVVDFGGRVKGAVGGAFMQTGQDVKAALGYIGQSFKSEYDRIANPIKEGMAGVGRQLQESLGVPLGTLKEKFGALWAASKEYAAGFEPLYRPVADLFHRVGEGAWNAAESVAAFGRDAAKYVGGFVQNIAKRAPEALDTFKGWVGQATGKVSELWEQMGGARGALSHLSTGFRRKGHEVERSTKGMTMGVTGMNDALEKLDKLVRQSKLGNLLSALSLRQLTQLRGGLSQLAGAGMQLTTGLEAQMTALSKTAKVSATQLGLTGREFREVSSQASGMAIGLNIGAEQATEALVMFKQEAKILGAIGVRSASDMAKVTEVTGLSAKDLTFQLRMMDKSLGLSQTQMQGIMSSFTAMGQQTGDVSGGLGSVNEMLEMLSRQAALMGPNVDKAKLADFAKQTAALAVGLKNVVPNAADARSISLQLGEALTSSREQMADLFTGVGSDVPEAMKKFAIFTSSMEESMGILEQGPEAVVLQLRGMLQQAEKSGANMTDTMNFLGRHLTAAGIQNADKLLGFLRSADDGVIGTMTNIKEATVTLQDLAKQGFSTGRTLQDEFDLIRDSMIMRFRSGTNVGSRFVKNFDRVGKDLMNTLDDLSAKGGPMGAFIDKMREMSFLGMTALLPEALQPMAVMFGTMFDQVVPLAGALGSLGFRFGMLLNPVILIGGALAYLSMKALGPLIPQLIDTYKATGSLTAVWEKLQAGILEAGPKIEQSLKNFLKIVWEVLRKAWVIGKDFVVGLFRGLTGTTDKMAKDAPFAQKLGAGIGEFMKNAFFMAVDAVKSLPWGDIWQGLKDAASTVWGLLVDFWKSIDWSKVWEGIKAGAQWVWDTLVGWFKDIDWLGIWQAVKDGAATLWDKFSESAEGIDWSGFADKLFKFLEEDLPDTLDKAITWLGDNLAPIVVKVLPKLLLALAGLGYAAFRFLFYSLPIKIMPKLLLSLLKALGTILGGLIYEYIIQPLGDIWVMLKAPFVEAWEWVKEKTGAAWDWVKKKAGGVVDSVKGFFRDGLKWISTKFTEFLTGAKIIWDGLKTFFSDLWEGIKLLFQDALDAISTSFDLAVAGAKLIWDGLTQFFSDLWDGIKTATGTAIDALKNVIAGPIEWIKEKWGEIKQFFADLWRDLKQGVEEAGKAIEGVFKTVSEPVSSFFEGIDGWVDKLFRNSISSDIQADMDKSVEVLQDSGTRITTNLQEEVGPAIVKELTEAYEKAYKAVTKRTVEFKGDQIKTFQELLQKLVTEFSRAFQNIANMSDTLTQGLSTAVRTMTTQLDKLSRGFERIAQARGEMAQLEKEKEEEAERGTETKAQVLSGLPADVRLLIKTTDNPEWWKSQGGARELLHMLGSKIDALRGVMDAFKATIPKGTFTPGETAARIGQVAGEYTNPSSTSRTSPTRPGGKTASYTSKGKATKRR